MINYPLVKHQFDEIDKNNIVKLFETQMLTMGKNVKEFENNFAKFHNRKYAVMTNSGSSANLLLIGSLVQSGLLKKGDRVVVPCVSWSTTFFPLEQYGLICVFVDVDLHTMSIKSEIAIEAAKKFKAKAIINVPLLGNYSEAKKLKNACQSENLIYLEDCCEAFGSTFENDIAGSLGFGSTQSFFYSHQLPAIEGGCILTDDRTVYDYLLAMRAHGWTRDLIDDSVFKIEKDKFLSSFRFVIPGYCLRPTEINAVLAQRRLELWESNFQILENNLRSFQYEFGKIKKLTIQQAHNGMAGFGFGFVLKEAKVRKKLTDKLSEQQVVCRPIVAGNFLENEAIKYMNFEVFGEMRNANKIDQGGLFIGNFPDNLNEKIRKTAGLVETVINE